MVDTSSTTLATCSAAGLQSAINATSNGRVALPAACNITLTAPLQVNKDVVIDGNGVTISGNQATRIFEVGRD